MDALGVLKARISHHIWVYSKCSYTTIKYKYLGSDIQSNFVFIFDNYLYIMTEVGVFVPTPTTHLLISL